MPSRPRRREPQVRGLLGYLRHQVRPRVARGGPHPGPGARRREGVQVLRARQRYQGPLRRRLLHIRDPAQALDHGGQQEGHPRHVRALGLRAPPAPHRGLPPALHPRLGFHAGLGPPARGRQRRGPEAREPLAGRRRGRLPGGRAGRDAQVVAAAASSRGAGDLVAQPHAERYARGPLQRDSHRAEAALLVQRVPALRGRAALPFAARGHAGGRGRRALRRHHARGLRAAEGRGPLGGPGAGLAGRVLEAATRGGQERRHGQPGGCPQPARQLLQHGGEAHGRGVGEPVAGRLRGAGVRTPAGLPARRAQRAARDGHVQE
mmetsp:Transcript_74682/g.230842  ORF Transcript_74682/g.230842 Transcript_74682/m.230842 type:complete len:320 (+) Transcript_74682:187-1146(+)